MGLARGYFVKSDKDKLTTYILSVGKFSERKHLVWHRFNVGTRRLLSLSSDNPETTLIKVIVSSGLNQ